MLAELGEFALRNDDLGTVLTEACRLVAGTLGTPFAEVLEIDHARQELLVRAGVGWRPGIVGRTRLPMGETSSETYSIKAGKPVVSKDIRKEDRFEFPAFMTEHRPGPPCMSCGSIQASGPAGPAAIGPPQSAPRR